ncbi:hypothetical protein [Gaoshiqia sp. Z1-71]|uniref:hypothetical protein n=1 Tax=Gaoshiqia hydrogeniformans TaxID=3290090 RepID=UPI003BF87CB2
MIDILEKTIRENKEAFETDAPEGHFARFEKKLDNGFNKKRTPGLKTYLQIAAAVLLVVLAGNQVRIYFSPEKPAPVNLSSFSSEYGEVEFYYTSAINQGMREWERYIRDGLIPEENQKLMAAEIAEFDETYARLQKELETNPEDDRIVNAMLELYRTRLSIITLIIEKLEEVKQQKLNNHETEI